MIQTGPLILTKFEIKIHNDHVDTAVASELILEWGTAYAAAARLRRADSV